jgi:hypothetical protein
MPQKFVVDRNGLRNIVVDNNPLKPDPVKVAELKRQNKGMNFSRQELLKQIEEENQKCNV